MVIKQRPTYENKKCTKLQTSGGRRRSRLDFRLAAKTYFPKMQSTEITQFINKVSNTDLIYNDFCSTIRRKTMVPRNCMITKEQLRIALNEKNLP